MDKKEGGKNKSVNTIEDDNETDMFLNERVYEDDAHPGRAV